MIRTLRPRLVAALLAASLTGTSCIEGPFEPFAPERDQPPLRFVGGAAPLEPFVWLAPVSRTDTTVRLEVRLRNAPRVAALVFELALEADVARIDSIIPGGYFAPVGEQPLVNVSVSPDDPRRWIGLVTLPTLGTASAGTGTLATVVVRRTVNDAFDIGVGFDTTTSRAFGVNGVPVAMNWTRGRLIQVPRVVP
ncbi:MAG: hypothetical protein MUF53_10945 [Gemmatimonadaceae bacterium]|jgi:hypothetical protein|nr:hypothetical protein [Gemmatimonadaceae bacterium]